MVKNVDEKIDLHIDKFIEAKNTIINGAIDNIINRTMNTIINGEIDVDPNIFKRQVDVNVSGTADVNKH